MGALVAATCALVAFIVLWPVAATGPSAIHQAYLEQGFNVQAASDLSAASGGFVDGFPGLLEAKLTLAVTKTEGDIASAHYVGVNQCRLTVLRGKGDAPAAPSGLRSARWDAGGNWYLALATGMDLPKFDAITQYLRQATQGGLNQNSVLAMQRATDGAAPCVLS